MTNRPRARAASAAFAVVLFSCPLALAGPSSPLHALVAPVAPLAPPALADPARSLVEEVNTLSRELGVPADHTEAIRAAGLPDAVAGRLVAVVSALVSCHRATQTALADLDLDAVLGSVQRGELHPSVDPQRFTGVRLCAAPLRAALAGLEVELRASLAGGTPAASLDAWPVLRLEAGNTDDVYVHDYALLVDVAGSDVYDNNAGSNLMDIESGPGSPAARRVGPAWGCITGAGSVTSFGTSCTPAAAALLDLAGDDTYGVFAPPHPDVDGICTADWVVRRVATIGFGLGGVGILRDVEGNDRYNGKDGTIGASHLFGVGILSDAAGDDTYLAVRNAQGISLVGGLGLLHDESGNDVYDWYMPSPLDPEAPNETPGAGGTPSSVGKCDNIPRFVQGIGNATLGSAFTDREEEVLVTHGVLWDESGDDFYRGVIVPGYPPPPGLVGGTAGSQGFGAEDGRGTFFDGGGTDVYEGVPDRADDTTVEPGQETTGTGGRFVDEDGGSGAVPAILSTLLPAP